MADALQVFLDAGEFIVAALLLAVGYVQGRRNERRHLAELARRERELRGVLIFATRYPPASAGALDPVMVSGSAVIAADYFRMFIAGLRKLVGGRFDGYEALISRARREAVVRLKEAARSAGCRMVFNLRIETSQIVNGARGGSTAVEVLAYGTAFSPASGTVAESPHHFVPGPPLAEKEGFDLAKNTAARTILAVLALLGIYWLAEMFGLQDYRYVASAPIGILAVTTALTVAVAVSWLRRHAVPWPETVGLGLLCLAVGAGAAYFAALRVNAATDSSPVRETVYVLQKDMTLRARDGDGPDLRFARDLDYWMAQSPGSEHSFELRRGALGVWQFNQSKHFARLRAHFLAQRAAR